MQTLADGRFSLVTALGGSGATLVYEAYDHVAERWCALQLLHPAVAGDPNLRGELEAGVRFRARIRHPSLVHIYRVGGAAEAWAAMELCRGGSLRAWVDANGPLQPRHAVGALIAVCQALSVAHQRGILHLDVRPETVLISDDGHAKLGGFGFARVVALEPLEVAQTLLPWTAPERRGGASTATEACDVYGAAATLFTLLTGRADAELYLCFRERDRLSGVPAPLIPVIQRACAYDAQDRYATVTALRSELDSLFDVLPAIAVTPGPLGFSVGHAATPPSSPRAVRPGVLGEAVPSDRISAPALVETSVPPRIAPPALLSTLEYADAGVSPGLRQLLPDEAFEEADTDYGQPTVRGAADPNGLDAAQEPLRIPPGASRVAAAPKWTPTPEPAGARAWNAPRGLGAPASMEALQAGTPPSADSRGASTPIPVGLRSPAPGDGGQRYRDWRSTVPVKAREVGPPPPAPPPPALRVVPKGGRGGGGLVSAWGVITEVILSGLTMASRAPAFVLVMVTVLVGAVAFTVYVRGAETEEVVSAATSVFQDELAVFGRALAARRALVDDMIAAGAAPAPLRDARTRYLRSVTEEDQWHAGTDLVDELHESVAVLELRQVVSRQELRRFKREIAMLEVSREAVDAAHEQWESARDEGWYLQDNAPQSPFPGGL